MEQVIKEGNAKVYGELKKIVTAEMEVFYNPVMQVNRDMTLLILAAEDKKEMKIADPLAGSGIRALRMLRELEEDKIKKIFVNDKKYRFREYFERNIRLNSLKKKEKGKLTVGSTDANVFLLENKVFDYIDIDPFGSPNSFLDAAIQSLRNKGIFAVTATDTSALCGSYPAACRRKYWAAPLRNELMHEFGLRILVRKVQLVGAQYDKALLPLFSYSKEHYVKAFFRCSASKAKVDEILGQHREIIIDGKTYGPAWMGQLWDIRLVDKMNALSAENKFLSKETKKLLETINSECSIEVPFFFDVHRLAKKKKTGASPQFERLIDMLESKGFRASRTHFSLTGIRTDADGKTFGKCFDEALGK
jgi:tRNA (guanine26-N2/guanine27-N2)-dimethyltransferase